MALWTEGSVQRNWSLAAALIIILLTVIARPNPSDIGIAPKRFRGSLAVIAIAAITASSILLTAWLAGTLKQLYGVRSPVVHALMYAVWALEQQFILNGFFFHRLEDLLGDNWKAVLGATALFSIAHIPNPI